MPTIGREELRALAHQRRDARRPAETPSSAKPGGDPLGAVPQLAVGEGHGREVLAHEGERDSIRFVPIAQEVSEAGVGCTEARHQLPDPITHDVHCIPRDWILKWIR